MDDVHTQPQRRASTLGPRAHRRAGRFAAAMGIVMAGLLIGASAAFAASAPNATGVWTGGLSATLGTHSIGLSGFGDGGTTTIPWATAAATDGAVGSGVQSESAGVLTMAPGSGTFGFAAFDPPITDPVFLVANGTEGDLLNFGTNVELLDSNNVTFDAGTGALSFTAAATGSADDGFAIRVLGTFGNVQFGDPGEASLGFSYSRAAGSGGGAIAVTVATPAPVVEDISTATTPSTPVTVSPEVDVPEGRTLDVAQTRLLDSVGDPVTTLTNADGTWEVDTSTGEITFTPGDGVTGPVTPVTFRVQDSAGIQATATISVEVVPEVGVPMVHPVLLVGAAAVIVPVGLVAWRRRGPAACWRWGSPSVPCDGPARQRSSSPPARSVGRTSLRRTTPVSSCSAAAPRAEEREPMYNEPGLGGILGGGAGTAGTAGALAATGSTWSRSRCSASRSSSRASSCSGRGSCDWSSTASPPLRRPGEEVPDGRPPSRDRRPPGAERRSAGARGAVGPPQRRALP
jgi:hypothetical protein